MRDIKLAPDTFGKETPALRYLCDLLNEPDNAIYRQAVAKRLGFVSKLIKQTAELSDTNFRRRVINTLFQEAPFSVDHVVIDSLTNNVAVTMIKRFSEESLIENHEKRREYARQSRGGPTFLPK